MVRVSPCLGGNSSLEGWDIVDRGWYFIYIIKTPRISTDVLSTVSLMGASFSLCQWKAGT